MTVSPYGGYGCTDRSFYDTDILINGFLYEGWSYNGVKSTVMHEMGHSLGLGHPCLMGLLTGQCSGECQALMGATGGEFTTPQQDDINGICQLYPGTAGGLGASCSSPSNCQSAPICVTYDGFSYCTHTCGSCEDGYECKNVNSQDVCVRKGAPSAGDVCTGVCATGAICVRDGGTDQAPIAHCYVSCTPPSTAGCPTDNRCVELDGGGGICWPAGTQQAGELCGTAQTGDCATGLVCLGDDPNNNTIAHCYRECDETRPSSCGTGFLCYDIGSNTGVCLQAAGPNQACEPPAADYTCESGWECTPPPDGGDTYVCNRACTINQPTSCGEGETCITYVNAQNEPVAAACYPEGNKLEGEICVTGYDCAPNLVCVRVSSTRTECLVQCVPSSPNCPHSGQTCEALQSGEGICFPAGGSTTSDGGTTTTDAASSGDSGVVNPNGRDYMEPCSQDGDCKFNLCRGVAGRGTICLQPCDPRLGHYDCPTSDDSGCVPEDVTALNFGGTCQPDVSDQASLGVGQSCSVDDGYRLCSSGLCENGTCLMVCNNTQCPTSYECDMSEIEDPGVCRPLRQAPLCGCATTGSEALALSPLLAGLLLWRRRRGAGAR